jgi:hypothetical protein
MQCLLLILASPVTTPEQAFTCASLDRLESRYGR